MLELRNIRLSADESVLCVKILPESYITVLFSAMTTPCPAVEFPNIQFCVVIFVCAASIALPFE